MVEINRKDRKAKGNFFLKVNLEFAFLCSLCLFFASITVFYSSLPKNCKCLYKTYIYSYMFYLPKKQDYPPKNRKRYCESNLMGSLGILGIQYSLGNRWFSIRVFSISKSVFRPLIFLLIVSFAGKLFIWL